MKKLFTIGWLLTTTWFYGAIHYVTSSADAGTNTLRQALINSSAGDTIYFDVLPSDTIFLSSPIQITKGISIIGGGQVISGQGTQRVMSSNVSETLYFENITLTKGYLSGGGGANFNGVNGTYIFNKCTIKDAFVKANSPTGGGLYFNNAKVTFNSCSIEKNVMGYTSSPNPGTADLMRGAGLYSSSCTIKFYNTTFESNDSHSYAQSYGGAIYALSADTCIISNCTFSGNVARSNLPRPSGGSAVMLTSLTNYLEITNNTFSDNHVPGRLNANYAAAGALYISNTFGAANVVIENNIFWDNSVPIESNSSLTDIYSNMAIIMGDYNILEFAPAASVNTAGSTIGVDPVLDALALNGSFTKTHAISCQSIAYKAGNPVFSGEVSQNGKVRKSLPDIGAYENGGLNKPTATITEPNCYGGFNGEIQLSNASPSYTYDWSTGQPTGKKKLFVQLLSEGKVDLFIQELGTGCMDTVTYTMTQPDSITIEALVENTKEWGNNGFIDLTVSGGTPGYMYNWSPEASTNEDQYNLPQGTYTVTVTDVNNCSKSKSFTIDLVTSLATKEKNGLSVFPMPAQGLVTLETSQNISSLTVLDETGKTLFAETRTNEIDLSSQETGTYFLVIEFENGETTVEKILLNTY